MIEPVRRWRAPWSLCLLVILLMGCSEPEVPPPIEVDPLTTVPAERVFKGFLSGKPVHLVVDGCKVFRAQASEGSWQMVLEPEPYPFFTSCARQSLTAEDGAVTVTIGLMAFGAGGCCATGGTYRTKDGEKWKKL